MFLLIVRADFKAGCYYYYLLQSSLKNPKSCGLHHIENVGLSSFWCVLLRCPRGEAGPLWFPMVCELRTKAGTAWASISVVYPHPLTLQGKLMSFTTYGTMSNSGMMMLTFYPMFQGWFSQKKCSSWAEPKWLKAWFAGVKLSRKAQVWYCSSQAEPKSSNSILIEQSHKLEFSKPSGWTG